MATRSRARTRNKQVAFYEVRTEDGEVLKEPTPWAEHLAELARESTADREHLVNGVPHWGQIYTYEETDHLVLARLRDGVSSLNTTTGTIIDTDSDAGNPWVEISVVHFMSDTNRLGFVLGSNASPRPSSLASWINQHRIFAEDITIEPVIAKDTLAKLQGAAEASMLRVKFTSDQLSQVGSSKGLFGASRRLQSEVGHVSIEMILKIEGGSSKARGDDRTRLLGITRDVVGAEYSKAFAKLLNYDGNGYPRSEDVDFLKQRLAMKSKIAITDRDGKPVRISSAIDAIYRAAEKFKVELYDG